MNKRPTSVTIVCWFLIIAGVLSIVMTMVTMNNPQVRELMEKQPLPVPAQIAMTLIITAINVVCGFFMLQGANWARMLYLGLAVLGFAYSLITSPFRMMVVPGLVFFGVFAFLLLRSPANAFFKGEQGIAPPPLP
jgi:uncharacterized membrane protein